MNILTTVLLAMSCVLGGQASADCLEPAMGQPVSTAATAVPAGRPQRAAEALDVVLTAKAAIAWDVTSGATLYAKNPNLRRPVASLSKLLSTLIIIRSVAPETRVAIPPAAPAIQRQGAHIRLPVGEEASVEDLLAASLIASANDAVIALAHAAAADEATFVALANEEARRLGLFNTRLANATGLPGGEQYSTANDVRRLLTLVYASARLGHYLDDAKGTLVTTQGTRRTYESTNELLSTYLPILAAKTGYTREAGENVALLTPLPSGHTVGIIILGSTQRFQDAKILTEWINRHYTWPE